jgi:hypothetical protein
MASREKLSCKQLFACTLSACNSVERIQDSFLKCLAGVRYLLASRPLANHPAINSVQRLQPEILRIRFYARTFP